MVLGASSLQIPIIRMAQTMGYKVVVVSISGNYPGFDIAEKSYQVDVRDQEQILRIAKKEGISAVVTDQTDIPVQTVAYVAKMMGLPGIDPDCARYFTNKFEMRKKCKAAGVPVPNYALASSVSEAFHGADQIGFPLIVKPVDSQGSRGVKKVVHKDLLETAFLEALNHSSCGNVLLEENFEGQEVVIQGFCAHGRFHNLVVGDRKYFDLPDLFIPSQTLFPSILSQKHIRNLKEINEILVQTLNPDFGITHSEYLIDDDSGEIRLVETAIRGGGVYIASDLVPLACGININRILLEHALGISTDHIDLQSISNRASGYICFSLPEGKVNKIIGRNELENIPGIHNFFLEDIEIGSEIEAIKDKTMRFGPILIKDKNRAGLNGIIEKIKKTLFIETITPEGVPQGIIW